MGNGTLKKILVVGMLFVGAFFSSVAQASAPILKITLIDPKGSTQNVNWKTFSEWVWVEKPKSRPVLRLKHRVLLPEDISVPVERNRSNAFTILEKTTFEDATGNWLEYESTEEATNFSVNHQLAAGKFEEKVLLLALNGVRESFLVHPSCEDAGYELTAKDLPQKEIHGLGATCEVKKDKLIIYFSHDRGISFQKFVAPNKGAVKKGKETPQGLPLLFDPKAVKVESGKLLAGFVFKTQNRPVVYQISLRESSGSKNKWGLAAALGPTYIIFNQNPGAIALTQLALTAKLFGTYQVGKKWTLGLGAFGTVISLMNSPATLPSARFIGINARVGYLFDKPLGGIRWSLSAGWYYTGMMVQNQAYGISAVMGPQIYVFGLTLNQKMFFYLKYAPISTTFGFPSFKSNEIAAGGGYRLSGPSEKAPWQVTVDLSYLKIGDTVSTTTYDITWMTFSASIQKTFRF